VRIIFVPSVEIKSDAEGQIVYGSGNNDHAPHCTATDLPDLRTAGDIMASTLSRTERWSLLLVTGGSLAVLANTFQGDGAPLVASLAFSALAFSMTYAFVRWSGPAFVKAGLKGKDMSKIPAREM
jgi:hypothetical protein